MAKRVRRPGTGGIVLCTLRNPVRWRHIPGRKRPDASDFDEYRMGPAITKSVTYKVEGLRAKAEGGNLIG